MRTARPKQLTPPGDWSTWLLMGGRGAGKTRTGAEDIAWFMFKNPGARIGVIAPTMGDARDTCFEGVSGLLSVIPQECILNWSRQPCDLTLWNGAKAKGFSAEEPDRLRGPQHHRVWCDELGAWRYPDAWDQMQFGLRLGTNPQAVVTTTPRPTVLVKQLIKDPKTILTKESTFANEKNLAASTLKLFKDRYSGTRLGRQELEAEVLDDVPGSLWTRARLDAMRVNEKDLPEMQRVVVGVDPAVGAVNDGDEEGRAETGIIVAGLGVDGRGYLLSDLSGRFSPDGWARRAVSGIDQFDGDAIVAETNQGGEMVVSTIRSVRTTVRVVKVHAAKGKVTRAEPVSALYEQDRISHVGQFPKLEDQMVAFTTDGIVGDTTADRVDAMVWAWSELFPRMTKKNTNKGPLKVETVSGYRPHGF